MDMDRKLKEKHRTPCWKAPQVVNPTTVRTNRLLGQVQMPAPVKQESTRVAEPPVILDSM
jgi:hypothetical protein